MKCEKCNDDFLDWKIHLSHDVPIYMFDGNKNEADKHGRRWLCEKCHWVYEWMVIMYTWKKIPKELQEQIKKEIEDGRLKH